MGGMEEIDLSWDTDRWRDFVQVIKNFKAVNLQGIFFAM
jgi:hypothetical protein